MKPSLLVVLIAALSFAGCSTPPVATPSAGHIDKTSVDSAPPPAIPAPVAHPFVPPPPKARPKAETYSVVVNNVPVHDLLFALARDAKINVDVHPGLNGLVTLNAIDQTLPELLARIAKQVDMRWDMEGQNLSVMPDKPYLQTYQIDFINISREVTSNIKTATQIASATSGSSSASNSASLGNSASSEVTSKTKNDLMESLIANVKAMLKEEDRLRYRAAVESEARTIAKAEGEGNITANAGPAKKEGGVTSSTESAVPGNAISGKGNQDLDARGMAQKRIGEYELAESVFANKETGVLIVRATRRQHEKIREFIDQVMRTARRQVLIEATIAEVTLSDAYQQGIDWSAISGSGSTKLLQQGENLNTSSTSNLFTLIYDKTSSTLGNITANIDLLRSFGNVRVLSSPKLSVMNNQTATLKVADSKIYFTLKADTTTNANTSVTTYTSTPNAVSIGFLMNVTPQITEADEVTLNIRPTITRITGYVPDPNPALVMTNDGEQERIVSLIPEIQTREMESIIRVASGQVAVMGGLMQDEVKDLTDAVPMASDIPILGELFKHRNDQSVKTELVVFIRPIVIKDASLDGDYARYRQQLPNEDFFDRSKSLPNRLNFGEGLTK